MEIKVGNKVRVSRDAPKMYYPKEEDGIVMEIDGEDALIKSEGSGMPHCSPFWVLAIPTKYLVKVDADAEAKTLEELHEKFMRFMSGRTPILPTGGIDRAHIQVLSQDDFVKELNPAEHDADKILSTAFGRGMAEVIAEKQARIDRLEQLIWMLHGYICRGTDAPLIDDDDQQTLLCRDILETSKTKQSKLCEICRIIEKKNNQYL